MMAPTHQTIRFAAIAWLVMGLFPAWLSYRFLYADGSAYLLHILQERWFFTPWYTRQSAQVLAQWPAVLAANLGVSSIPVIAYAMGAGMMGVPVLIHAAALMVLLKRGWSMAAILYSVMLMLLIKYSGLMSVGEAHVSAALFLLALVVAVGRERGGLRTWILLGVVGVVSFRLYEFWFFYASFLALAVLVNNGSRFSRMTRPERAAISIVLCVMTCSAVLHALRLLGSSGNPNRNSFLSMLTGSTLPIYLALIAAWFLLCCVCAAAELRIRQLPICRERSPVLWSALWIFLVALLALSAMQYATMVRYSYPFRVLNLILPLLYAVWLLVTLRDQSRTGPSASWHVVVAVLCVFLLLFEVRATLGWRRYFAWEGAVRRQSADTIYVQHVPKSDLAKTWIYPWTQSAVSFLSQALRDQRIRGISFHSHAGWNPYGPGAEQQFRTLALQYGVVWE